MGIRFKREGEGGMRNADLETVIELTQQKMTSYPALFWNLFLVLIWILPTAK